VIPGFLAWLQPGLRVIRLVASAVAVGPAGMPGKERLTPRETQAIRRGLHGQGVTSLRRRDGRARGLAGHTPWARGPHLGHGGQSERRQWHGPHRGPLGLPSPGRWRAGLAVHTPRGDGLAPVPGRGREGAEGGELETREDRRVALPHAVFDPAFFLALANLTRGHRHAVVRGTVGGWGMEHGGRASRTLEDGGGARIDQDVLRKAPQAVQGLWRTGQAVCQGVRDGARDGQHATGAQAHAPEAPLAVRVPDGDRTTRTPIPLGPCAGGQGEGEKGRLPAGADRAAGGFDEGLAAGKAPRAPALEDWRRRRGRPFQPPPHVRFDRLEWTHVRSGFARATGVLGQPGGHCAALQRDCLRALGGVEALARVEVCELTATVIIDQDHPSPRRAHTALTSTGSSSATLAAACAGASRRAGVSRGAASRAHPWESGRW
jgi:hypothetical protein